MIGTHRSILAARVLAVLVLAGLAAALPVSAQSLMDNTDYRKARELQTLAEAALAEGDYDRANEYALEASQYASRAEEYAARLLMKYKANGWRQQARNHLADASASGAESSYAAGFTLAAAEYGLAESTYTAGEYEVSIEHSKSALAALQGFQPAPPPVRLASGTPAAAEPVYPRYYRVRLIPEDRDCLNKIAGYPFVFNDRYQWKKLYEANRAGLKHPDNPHLIFPGQVLVIPSLQGEKREGTLEPGRQYPVFPAPASPGR